MHDVEKIKYQPDVIVTSLCLEGACTTYDQYKQALRNIASLLKPGGKLVLFGVLNSIFYRNGKHYFQDLTLTEDQVKNAVSGADLSINEKFTNTDIKMDQPFCKFDGAIVVYASKP